MPFYHRTWFTCRIYILVLDSNMIKVGVNLWLEFGLNKEVPLFVRFPRICTMVYLSRTTHLNKSVKHAPSRHFSCRVAKFIHSLTSDQ